jgi:hypothetical protein
MTDGSSGDTSTLTIGVTPVNDAPVVGNATTTVSEEGLGIGIPDINGTPDTTDSAIANGTVVFNDVDTNDTHTVTLSSPSTPLTSNATAITWTGDNTQTLTGMAGSTTIVIITIDNDGNYTVNLEGSIDHPDPGAEDVISFIVPVNVYDGTDTSSGSLTINIEDDSPTIVADYDAIIANEQGNSLTVPLDINFGADGPNTTTPVQLNGPTIDGFVVDNNGDFVTSDGINLVYQSDGSGGLIAVKDGTSTQIFSITVDPVAETYTVTIHGPLDGAAGTDIDLTTGGSDPGNNAEVYFYGGEDTDNDGLGDIQIRITGYDENGNPGEVNSSKPGMGVNNNWLNNLVDENPEQLFMVFSDTSSTNDPYAMTAAEITVNSMDSGEEAVWKVYNTNGHTSDEFKADPTLWELVNEGSAPGSASANTTFIVEGGVNPDTGLPDTFDAIILEASDGSEYRVLNATTFTSDSGSNTIITYDSPSLQVFDADGDHNDANTTFDVTFDADGNITGTNANEVIAGSSHSNLIFGGDGADVISGGSGDDTLDGGTGDDTLTGGDGADTFKVAEGDDTITDYNQAEGDIVDISDMFESVDTLAVSENPDGSVKLSILDGSPDEKGSVSFENIEFVNLDSDPGVDLNGDGDMNELDSLLVEIDIDDGTI